MKRLTRRLALKLTAFSALFAARRRSRVFADEALASSSGNRVDAWDRTQDRVWLGGAFWANPMEDWRVVDGAAECQSRSGNRNIHLLTHELVDPAGNLAMSVVIERADDGNQGSAGFRLGVHSELNEHRSNVFAAGGIDAGFAGSDLFISIPGESKNTAPMTGEFKRLRIHLTGTPVGDRFRLTLRATNESGDDLGELSRDVKSASVLGNLALVNNDARDIQSPVGGRFRFSDWHVGGSALKITPTRKFGPILWTMYTLSDSRGDEGFVMKLTAFTGPLGKADHQDVELQVRRDGVWKSLGSESLDRDSWTATFRIAHWDQQTNTPYRVVYAQTFKDGSVEPDTWEGTIQANPTGRPLRMAALTCQHWYAFPYEPVVENVVRLKPDLLYFSGDQIYESHGGYGFIQEPADAAILCYLRKFYLFGWAFRDALKDAPTVCLPDDHDVFQGNIWGAGGKPMANLADEASSRGGYREPARMVNVVHRTCTSQHPDCDDPTPSEQAISVYYGDLVYGDVSFAILGDRQWKSGPETVNASAARADHVADPDFDTSRLDQPGLELLGERQEDFLERWAADWRGHTMKVVLSQTVFAGAATHHAEPGGPVFLKADLDSSGWPQSPRDRAIKIMSKAMPLHINGDQHLTTLLQYGVEEQRDSCWSFCTPAIGASYQRWWLPDQSGMPHTDRPSHGLPQTGKYVDGLGNKIYVFAVGNPQVGKSKNRYQRAHEKASGFGFVTIDPKQKTYTIDAFRFLVDALKDDSSNQFEGWPVTLHQRENGGDNLLS